MSTPTALPTLPPDAAATQRRALDLFAETFGGVPDGVWAAPGRVNIIGEHVDYQGGFCLPMALEHRTYAAVRQIDDAELRLISEGFDQVVVPLADLRASAGTWAAYPAGVVWALAQIGLEPFGLEIAFASSVPTGGGLSSSAAIEAAVALAVDELADRTTAADGWRTLATSDEGRARLAAVCVRAENEVVGAPTGGMDQAAALRAQAGAALLLDTDDASVAQVPWDLAASGLELLIVDTRAHHALVDGQYGARRADVEEAAAALGVRNLRALGGDLARLDGLAAHPEVAAADRDRILRRARHVVTEIARVERFAALLAEGPPRDHVAELGALLTASHASLRDDFEVSVAELDTAVEAALAAGAHGARMVGGGFGGSAIALIEADASERTRAAVAEAFAAAGFGEPQFVGALPGAAGERVG